VIVERLQALGFQVDSVKVSFNVNGESRGYGFILFSTKDDASKFINNTPAIGNAPIEANSFIKRLSTSK
jgi:hypothetical protein